MKQLFAILLLCSSVFTSCSSSHSITNIEPKSGTIEIPAKGEYRMWRDVQHGSFLVTLTNSSAKQSVELYQVKSDGNEKWVSPSLLANSSLDVTIPADGHLFIKNFNDDVFTITYKIAD
ncbi:MAG: hypothetical protein ABIU77_01065 [Ferruginibacter sp.]